MDKQTLEQTLMIAAVVFACASLILINLDALVDAVVTILFGVVCYSMGLGLSRNGYNRRFWDRVIGETVE